MKYCNSKLGIELTEEEYNLLKVQDVKAMWVNDSNSLKTEFVKMHQSEGKRATNNRIMFVSFISEIDIKDFEIK